MTNCKGRNQNQHLLPILYDVDSAEGDYKKDVVISIEIKDMLST